MKTEEETAWPEKTHEVHNHHFDSTIWNDFKFRDDDIVISTYAKSGTTWLQQIVSQILFPGEEDLEVAAMSPWMDLRVPPKEVKLQMVEAQTHRRFVKTHLPVDALVYSPRAKYLYVVRDGRDVVWSLHNHHSKGNEKWYGALNGTPGRVGGPIPKPNPDVREYFRDWLAFDGYPFWSFWDSVRTWWAIRKLPNVLFLHYADLKADLPGQMRRVAAFLDVPVDEGKFDKMVEACGFDYMKERGEKSVPLNGALWEGGCKSFVHKGTNGRWRDVLTEEDCADYERKAREELGEECANWMMNGGNIGD